MRFFKAGDHFRHRVAAAGIGVFDRLQRAGHGMASENVERSLLRFVSDRFEVPAGVGADHAAGRDLRTRRPQFFIFDNGKVDITQSDFVRRAAKMNRAVAAKR